MTRFTLPLVLLLVPRLVFAQCTIQPVPGPEGWTVYPITRTAEQDHAMISALSQMTPGSTAVSIGMSNTRDIISKYLFKTFRNDERVHPNPAVRDAYYSGLVQGAQGGMALCEWSTPGSPDCEHQDDPWDRLLNPQGSKPSLLQKYGATTEDVELVYLMAVRRVEGFSSGSDYVADSVYRTHLVIDRARAEFPNLRAVILIGMHYGGYSIAPDIIQEPWMRSTREVVEQVQNEHTFFPVSAFSLWTDADAVRFDTGVYPNPPLHCWHMKADGVHTRGGGSSLLASMMFEWLYEQVWFDALFSFNH